MKYLVGVDVGGTNVRIALGNAKGNIAVRLNERSDKLSGPRGLSSQIKRMIRSLVDDERILCIGIGSAGPLDLKKGAIVHSPHLGFDRIPLLEPLEKEFRVPVCLVNDCVAAVVAEKVFGEGKKSANLVYVTVSSGIGGGAFVDNHLLRGKDGNAHEVGHVTIDQARRLLCGCGKRGHWEAYCGGDNIPNLVRLQLESEPRSDVESSLLYGKTDGNFGCISSRILFDAAKCGDKLASRIVDEIGRLNALGFANVNAVYDPEVITVGGAIALANPNLVLNPVRKLINESSINRKPRIKLTTLGEDIVLYGALALANKLKR